jgi:hypothetical protein
MADGGTANRTNGGTKGFYIAPKNVIAAMVRHYDSVSVFGFAA